MIIIHCKVIYEIISESFVTVFTTKPVVSSTGAYTLQWISVIPEKVSGLRNWLHMVTNINYYKLNYPAMYIKRHLDIIHLTYVSSYT